MNRILLIEDDHVAANIYRNKLAVEGYQVEIARDGEVGFEMLRTFRPDAVILDLMLPKVPGLELLKRIRAEAATHQLPVIVFSNTYLASMVQDAWKAGATKCLSKANCTPKQMIDLVRTVLVSNGAAVPGQPVASSTSTASTAGQNPASDADAAFTAELRKTFIESLPSTLGTLRAGLQAVVRADNEVNRLKLINELYRRVHALTSNAGIAEILPIAQMSDAVEALLKELYEKPRNVNASTIRTVALAVDFLGVLFDRCKTSPGGDVPPASILVVDDEAISRRAVTYALEKAQLKSVAVEDPLVALGLLGESDFDLVILDVDMPVMTGFELCSKLRALPQHKDTPVVFVTSLNDFESRASSMMSGGNDFIAKPFLFIELAVKALMYVLRGRMEDAETPETQAK